MRFKSSIKCIGAVSILLLNLAFSAQASGPDSKLQSIINEIEKHEGDHEPKCYATASRLEDFMFGTPLSNEARFNKNKLQKQWVEQVWQSASVLAGKQGKSSVDKQHIGQVVAGFFSASKGADGHFEVGFADYGKIKVHHEDKRQYSSISYSLRALLAVQQAQLLQSDMQLLPLGSEAIRELTHQLDLLMLAILKVSDLQARKDNLFEVSDSALVQVWDSFIKAPVTAAKSQQKQPRQLSDLSMLKSIVEQKIRSYAKYNNVSQQLFVRNLQVYFARNRWPETDEAARAFRQMFTETVIAFAADLYFGAQQMALKANRGVITEADVDAFSQLIIPHQINEYEDAVFFHRLPPEKRVTIESYDMDAFRDSGIHWRYLQFAVTDRNFKAYLEPDPFAAELLVENIAQFGVLLLRMTGVEGRNAGDKRISSEHMRQAMQVIQTKVSAHAKQPEQVAKAAAIKSTEGATSSKAGQSFFTDVTQSSGVEFMHRSSDWLNRMLRGFLTLKDGTGTISIPPAFGGAGVAAEDINNDGLEDVLILSGLGNRLYLNRGNGRFEDVTSNAGIDWRGKDNRPGEPRQPLIADLNNDGLQDIVITYVDATHRVYQNLGDGKFADVTDNAGLGGEGLVGGPATVFDYDNDGLLDIYITYFGDYINGVLPTLKRRNTNGLPNKLFKNIGGFKFKETTKGSGLANTGWGQAVTHMDFDGDGVQDLIVGNDFGVNAYYKNLGQGRFKNVSAALGVEKPSYTMGIGSSDLNADGTPDIYISNIVTMNKDEKYVLPNAQTQMKFNPEKLAHMRVVEANDLFISDDDGRYQMSKAIGRGYSSTGWSWDADFFDFDNDGDDDLYVLNGINEFNLYSNENPYYTDPLTNQSKNIYIPVSTKESNVLFVNEGGKLNNVSKDSGVDLTGNSRSAAYFDLEGDGDLDIVVNNYHGKAYLYRNNAEQYKRHWLKIKLTGSPKDGVNLDAIGAQIIVTTKQGNRIWRMIQGSTGYMSVHPKLQHVGLKDQSVVDIEIVWPNGKRSRLHDVKSGQVLKVDYAAVNAAG